MSMCSTLMYTLVCCMFCSSMIRRPPRSTRTDTLIPDTTLCRSLCRELAGLPQDETLLPYLLSRRRPNGSFNNAPARDGGDGNVLHTYWSLLARSEEHTSELQSLMRISYAVFCL